MNIFKKTKSVTLILDSFNEKEALSIIELVDKFANKMNKTTVYRILERLEEASILHSFVDQNPVILMEHKLIYKQKSDVILNPIPSNSDLLGKANVINEGDDLTIVSYSNMVNVVKEAINSDELSGLSVELVDLQTISPLDVATVLNSVRKTKKLLMAQEAPANSSVGTTVITKVVESDVFSELTISPKLISGLHSPMPSAKHLESTVIPQVDDIIEKVKGMV